MQYDVIVVGAGHAGIEAARAASRLKCSVLLLTMNPDTIGMMSCNPAIGGLAKGQIVREIDALGGDMALAIDATGIQFRTLNTKKGPAVQSPRAQADKMAYAQYMRTILEQDTAIDIKMESVQELICEGAKVIGVRGIYGDTYYSKTVVITPGTFLNGMLHIGSRMFEGGRLGEFAAHGLSDQLKALGFPVKRLKTGTPARVDGRTINYEKTDRQDGDIPPKPFSYRTKSLTLDQVPCFKTHTNERTHAIIEESIHLSAINAGNITGIGPRYCPSIEDKVHKFADKTSHLVFIEPEGRYTDEKYLNGISTSLPAEVQDAFIRTIPGLEDVRIVRFAYAVEYDFVEPYVLKETLETKPIENLFLAGQINGTSGYEEAAGQGLIAGANAALKVLDRPPFTLGRDEAYIGVLIDDLITKSTEEPYRMFTSSAEYRLLLRSDNADERLTEKAFQAGLVDEQSYEHVMHKYDAINREIDTLRTTHLKTDNETFKQHNGRTLYHMLKMPEVSFATLCNAFTYTTELDEAEQESVEIRAKYDGYIEKSLSEIEAFKRTERIRLPEEFDYSVINGLTIEARQKLNRFKPSSVGQASRISGISPSDVSVLIIYFTQGQK